MPRRRKWRPAVVGGPTGVRYRWNVLRTEWIQRSLKTDISLEEFRKEKGIGSTILNKHAEEEGWVEERDRLRAIVEEKVFGKTVEEAAETWKLQTEIWETVEKQGLDWLLKNITKAGEIKKIKPGQLAQLTLAIERALKARRLMAGKSTEITEQKNYVMAIATLIQDFKKSNPDVLNSAHTIPGFDPAKLPGAPPKSG